MSKRLRIGGFTLVELLVVVGIIAVLVGMLIPSLNRAREQARQVQCASNMRSILQAMTTYAEANQEYLPIPCSRSETTPANPLTKSLAFPCVSNGILDFQHGTFGTYLGSTPQARMNVMNCPSDMEPIRPVGVGGTVSMVNRNFSYSFNCYLRGPTSTANNSYGFVGFRTSMIVHPAAKVLVFEEQWPNDLTCEMDQWGTFISDDVPALRHVGRCNMGFADGHVDAYQPADFGVVMVENGSSGQYTASFLTDPSDPSDPHHLTEQFCDLLKP